MNQGGGAWLHRLVSYTWPDLLSQAPSLGKATVMCNFPLVLIGAGLLIYPLVLPMATLTL